MKQEAFTLAYHRPDKEDFVAHFSHHSKLVEEDGALLWEELTKPEAYLRALVATRDLELPAVAGIAKLAKSVVVQQYGPIEQLDKKFWDRMKQYIGCVMYSVMVANGYKKSGRKRSVPEEFFNKAELYEPAGS